MSVADDLVKAYSELQNLSREVEASLKNGVDLAVLTPLFERKAAVSEQIKAWGVPGSDLEPAQLKRLLDAQSQAAQAEADLVQALQAIVSSIGTIGMRKSSAAESQTGKKWDLSG
jgi:hypothetical protein